MSIESSKNICNNCLKPTNNPKFCSQSCAAIYNNSGVRRHGEQPSNCPCGNKLTYSKRKYCSLDCRTKYTWEATINLIEENKIVSSEDLGKKYLIYKYGHTCMLCKLSEWQGNKIPLVIDHIDGHSEDNSLSNLRIICCNCDALTPTYKAKNKGNGRKYRK